MTITTPETAYKALQHAAEVINRDAWRIQRRKAKKPLRTFTPDLQAAELIEASSAVLGGTLDVEEAMALLHYGETAERLRKARVNDRS